MPNNIPPKIKQTLPSYKKPENQRLSQQNRCSKHVIAAGPVEHEDNTLPPNCVTKRINIDIEKHTSTLSSNYNSATIVFDLFLLR